MNTLIMTMGIFIGTFTTTAYRSVPAQTDSSPYITSIGYRVSSVGVAVSQDLLCSRAKLSKSSNLLCKRSNGCPQPWKLHYNDLVYIEDVGYKIVFDCMNERHRNRVDVWTSTYEGERKFHQKFKNRKLVLWIVPKGKHELRREGAEK